ncbi:ferredoxin [Microbacterium terregens]|jgi:ferredoxin|uniref:Ferredoxin n=1 Tax=Microbacterium terregens TaxID=69363 RepID=A0ABV5T2N2_9MICO
MRVTINPTTCIASANCSRIAPRVFANRDEDGGFVSVLDEHPPEAEWTAAREAEALCPSATIHLIEDGGRRRFLEKIGGD